MKRIILIAMLVAATCGAQEPEAPALSLCRSALGACDELTTRQDDRARAIKEQLKLCQKKAADGVEEGIHPVLWVLGGLLVGVAAGIMAGK